MHYHKNPIPILHPCFVEAGRKKQMVSDMGLGQYLFDLDQVPRGEMEGRLDEAYQDWEAVSARFQKAYRRMRDLGRESMAVVARAISG